MNVKSLTPDDLLQRLADGWPPERAELAQEFAQRWLKHLQVDGKIEQAGPDWLQFNLDLSSVRFHGSDNVAVLLLGGAGEQAARATWDFWYRVNSADRLVLMLALSAAADEQSRAALPNIRCVRLTMAQVRGVMQTNAPRDRLKALIRQQLPLHQLIPYNITLPVNANMFFGRQDDLERLLYEPETSFAIAGPGRLGKTSLALHFHKLLVRTHDARAQRRYHIDFYDCPNHSSDGVARFFAMKVKASRRSNEMTTGGVINFLRYQQVRHGGPLELLLDEIDEVCHVEAFEMLAMAARLGLCRLVLCGRGNLLKAVTNEHSPLRHRVELLRLRQLDESSARSLILDPLADLGFKVEQPERLVELIFHWTGRLPHLVQFYCKRLVNLTRSQAGDTIDPTQVNVIRSEFETVQLFATQLESLSDAQTRTLALHLLQQGERVFTVHQVQKLAGQLGQTLDHRRAAAICDELVINHVLAWQADSYCIANHSLAYYAHKVRLQDGVFTADPAPIQLPV